MWSVRLKKATRRSGLYQSGKCYRKTKEEIKVCIKVRRRSSDETLHTKHIFFFIENTFDISILPAYEAEKYFLGSHILLMTRMRFGDKNNC